MLLRSHSWLVAVLCFLATGIKRKTQAAVHSFHCQIKRNIKLVQRLIYIAVESLSHVRLFCEPTNYSRIFSGKNTGVDCPFLLQGMFPTQRGNPCLLHWQASSLSRCHLGSLILYICMCCAESLQSCQTLCDPMDCSLPGSSVHEIFQARVLEWGAIALSFLSLIASNTLFSCSLGSCHSAFSLSLGHTKGISTSVPLDLLLLLPRTCFSL